MNEKWSRVLMPCAEIHGPTGIDFRARHKVDMLSNKVCSLCHTKEAKDIYSSK